jgi:hypothetical protein
MSEPTPALPSSRPPNAAAPPVIRSSPVALKRPWLLAALGVLALFVVGMLFAFNPTDHSFYPFCIFYRVTGWQCPGCGGLRAVHQLLHGHLMAAFRFNPLVVAALPMLVAWAAIRRFKGPGQPVSHRAMALRAWVAFVVLVAFWIVRNLPIDFFHPPA